MKVQVGGKFITLNNAECDADTHTSNINDAILSTAQKVLEWQKKRNPESKMLLFLLTYFLSFLEVSSQDRVTNDIK